MADKRYAMRAHKVLNTLIVSGSDSVYTPIEAISDPSVTGEDPEAVQGTLKVMALMGHIETTEDDTGITSYRLTQSGSDIKEALPQEGA